MKWLVDPYNKPTVAGTVFSGLESILKLVNTVQGMKDSSETRAQNKALKPLEAARMIRGDNQEVPVSAENAADFEKAFKTSWPKTTEEGRTKKMGSLADQISSQIPTTEVAGRKLTSPTQAQQLGTPAYDKEVAELPAAGSPQSLPAKQPKSLDEYILRQIQGGGQGGGTDQAVGLYNSLKHPGLAGTQAHQKVMEDQGGQRIKILQQKSDNAETPEERRAAQRDLMYEKEKLVRGRPEKPEKSSDKMKMYDQYKKIPGNEKKTLFDMDRDLAQSHQDVKPVDPTKAAKAKDIEAKTRLKNSLSGEEGGSSGGGGNIVHTSDHELTPEEAAALLKKIGK